MSKFTYKVFFFFILMLMTLSLSAQINIETKVNADKIGTDDILELKYTFTAPRGGIEEKIPMFSGFRLIMNNKVIINNQYEYTFHLQPVTAGNYTIPELTIIDAQGNLSRSDKVRVQVIKGKILKNSGSKNSQSPIDQIDKIRQQLFQDPYTFQQLGDINEHFFIIAETSKNSYFLGEPIYVTYKLYNNTGFSGANITSLPNNSNFISKNFDFEEQPEEKIETYNNVPFRTFTIKKVILYGFKTGTYDIGGMTISAFVDFFGKAEAKTKNKNITIKPLPPVPANKTFQGGVGEFSISAQYSQVNTTTDDPITLTINITGSGNIESTSLPTIGWPAGITVSEPDIEIYTNKHNPNISTRSYTFYVYSEKDTSVVIPEAEWTYFDTKDNTYKTLSISEQALHFFPGTPSPAEDTSNEASSSVSYGSDSETSSGRALTYILIILGAGGAILAGFLFYKKQKSKYNIRQDSGITSSPESIQGEQIEIPDHQSPVLPHSQIEARRDNQYSFDGFNIEQLIHESKFQKEIEFFKYAHQNIILFLQSKGVRNDKNDSIIKELKMNNVNHHIISQLEDVFTYISTQYYNPLPVGEIEKENLLKKIQGLYEVFSSEK